MLEVIEQDVHMENAGKGSHVMQMHTCARVVQVGLGSGQFLEGVCMSLLLCSAPPHLCSGERNYFSCLPNQSLGLKWAPSDSFPIPGLKAKPSRLSLSAVSFREGFLIPSAWGWGASPASEFP